MPTRTLLGLLLVFSFAFLACEQEATSPQLVVGPIDFTDPQPGQVNRYLIYQCDTLTGTLGRVTDYRPVTLSVKERNGDRVTFAQSSRWSRDFVDDVFTLEIRNGVFYGTNGEDSPAARELFLRGAVAQRTVAAAGVVRQESCTQFSGTEGLQSSEDIAELPAFIVDTVRFDNQYVVRSDEPASLEVAHTLIYDAETVNAAIITRSLPGLNGASDYFVDQVYVRVR